MKRIKTLIAAILICSLVLGVAHSAGRDLKADCTLHFFGRTAICTVSVSGRFGERLNGRMTLYRVKGQKYSKVKSWRVRSYTGKLHKSKRVKVMQSGYYRLKFTAISVNGDSCKRTVWSDLVKHPKMMGRQSRLFSKKREGIL